MVDTNSTEIVIEGELVEQQALIPETESDIQAFMFAEGNYDRFGNFLFPPRQTKGLDKPRKSKPVFVLGNDGKEKLKQLRIFPSSEGRCYTTRTYEVFQALTQIWTDHGKTDDPVKVPISEVARRLDLKTSGRVLSLIQSELETLRRTITNWISTYKEGKDVEAKSSDHSVLDTLEFTRRVDPKTKKIISSYCEFRFSEEIRNSYRNGVTTPINFKARKAIRSDICKSIYSRIDSEIFGKKRLENKVGTIVERYYLSGERYKYKSQRKGLAEVIKKGLNGVETSREGVFLIVDFEETVDGKDWKVIYSTRGEGVDTPLLPSKGKKTKLPVVNKDKDFQEYLVSEIVSVVGGSDENLGLYRLFARHYSENHIFRALGEFKELKQANHKIEKPQAYFTSIVHVIAHKLNVEWIQQCDHNCRLRPENQLF